MKTFTPAIYNVLNPVGFDLEIAAVQSRLACITWMEAVFGVAHIQARKQLNPETDKNDLIYFPQARKLQQDVDLTIDDSYASRCFFVVKDPINVSPDTDRQDWTTANIEIAQPFSLIFNCDLSKLETDNYEIVKTGVLYALNQCPKIVLGTCYEDIYNIWKGFTVTEQLLGFTKYPYYAMRVDGVLTYMAFPFNGNGNFDPATLFDINNLSIQPNTNPGYANTN